MTRGANASITGRGLSRRWWQPRIAAGPAVDGENEATPLAAPGAAQDAAPDAGLTRANPIALGAAADTGLVTIQVLEVVTGGKATEAVKAASSQNTDPRDGVTYVLVRLSVANTGQQPVIVSNDDFALTGSDNLVRRFVGVEVPEPRFELTLTAGQDAEGWVALSAATDETNLLLWYDSVSTPGSWTNRYFALTDGAKIDPAPAGATKNDAGASPNAAVSFNTVVATDEWQLTLVDTITGADVLAVVDYRTGALGENDPAEVAKWIASRFAITCTAAGEGPFTFPSNAFGLVSLDGQPIPNMMTLTPPSPDAAGDYFRGGTREGWVAFELAEAFTASGAPLVRFAPFAVLTGAPDPRFFNIVGAEIAPAPGVTAETPASGFETGANVVVTEDDTRFRDAPSTGGGILAGLAAGTALVITGPPVTADGYTWYPVNDSATDQDGFVVADFLKPADQ